MDKESQVLNAISNAELKSSKEKLVLFCLVQKHELGDSNTNTWRSMSAFMSKFSDKWCSMKELVEKTRLSDKKLIEVLDGLKDRGYIKVDYQSDEGDLVTKKPNKKLNNKSKVLTYAITDKIFNEFGSSRLHKTVRESA